MAKFIVTETMHHSGFLLPKMSAKFQWDHSQVGHKYRCGGLKLAIIDQYLAFSLYLRNGARWVHSYYGRLIVACLCLVKWCCF